MAHQNGDKIPFHNFLGNQSGIKLDTAFRAPSVILGHSLQNFGHYVL